MIKTTQIKERLDFINKSYAEFRVFQTTGNNINITLHNNNEVLATVRHFAINSQEVNNFGFIVGGQASIHIINLLYTDEVLEIFKTVIYHLDNITT